MNKGFAYYFRQAFKNAAAAVWKNKNVLKSMTYFFLSLVARATVILGALIDLADVRYAKIAKNQQTVDIPQSLTRASQKPLWTMIVARILEFLIYIGGFLLVSIVCGAVFALGLVIAQFVSTQYFTLICIIFAVPCLIIYAVYSIIVIAVFAPTAYVIDSNPELSAGDVVSVCVNSMKNRGKMTVILSVFVPSLIMFAVAAVCGAGFMLISMFLFGTKLYLLLMLVWAIVAVVALGLTVPVFNTTKNLSLVLLFEDIALDPVNARKRTAGINIKKISGARVDREEIADNLDALFDDGIEEMTPDPAELVHKHKKKRKKKAEAAPQPVAAATVPDGQDVKFEEIDDYADEAPKPEEQQTAQPAETVQTATAPSAENMPASSENVSQGATPEPDTNAGATPDTQTPPQGAAQVPPQGARPVPNGQVPPQGARPMPNGQVPPQGARPMPNGQVPPQGASPMHNRCL